MFSSVEHQKSPLVRIIKYQIRMVEIGRADSIQVNSIALLYRDGLAMR